MEGTVNEQLQRREALAVGLSIGVVALVSGCARKRWKPLTDDQLRRPIPDSEPTRIPDESPPVAAMPSGVIPRREWTSTPTIAALANPMNGVRRITIHHSGIVSGGVRSKADAARMLEAIRRGHVSQQWADIGYHFIIDPAGRIWEGRPLRYQGAHVKLNNEHNLAVMVMGNFDEEQPTPQAVGSLDRFVAEQMRIYRVPVRQASDRLSGLFTHQELMATACPGRALQRYMVAARSSSGALARA